MTTRVPVRLETEAGELVHDGHILPFVTGYPKAVVWGERIFILHRVSKYEVRIERLERDLVEAGDRRDSARCDFLEGELEKLKLEAELHKHDDPAVYRETFCAFVLPEEGRPE